MKKYLLAVLLFCFAGADLMAQKENPMLRKGNNQYEKGNFKEAEKNYRKALEINKESVKGKFNLGAAVYQENNFDESAKLYSDLSQKNDDRDVQSKIFHNLGNSLLEAKQYDKSILAYKNALMNNPKDLDTKYNLEYAKMMLKKQQQQQQKNQNNQDKNKQDQKKDQQKQDQKQDQKNQPPQDQKKLSKEDASRMLEALKNDEKKTLQKVKKEKAKVQVTGIDKDW